jgi:hypothetical protein
VSLSVSSTNWARCTIFHTTHTQALPERLGGIGVLIGVLDELGAMHDFPHYPHASLKNSA